MYVDNLGLILYAAYGSPALPEMISEHRQSQG